MKSPRPYRNQRSEDVIKELAMNFIKLESNGTSLVTVTDIDVTNRGKNALILFTVFPEDKQDVVLDFLKRKRPEFREFIKENSRLGIIPFIDFGIDFGERNRQNVDRLL